MLKEKKVLLSKEELMKSPRYKDYAILDTPKKFSEMFRDCNYLVVELESIIKPVDDGVLFGNGGFQGSFMWINNTIISLDGDSYEPELTVYGYLEFSNKDVANGLIILVGNDW